MGCRGSGAFRWGQFSPQPFHSNTAWKHGRLRPPAMTTETRTVPEPAAFLTTRWTRVCIAKADSDDGRRALSDLCNAYYEPVVAYLRSVLRDADAAREMSHAFFGEVLAGGRIHTADPERGRFRFYLLGAVKHFVAHRRESDGRLRRGGGVPALSLDAASPDSPALNVADDARRTPEAIFDRQWAVTVLSRAMDSLHAECAAEEKCDLLEQLRPWLLGESGYGDQTAAAEKLGMSASAMKAAVHRMRHRFRQCVKAEIAGTLKDAAAVEEEMRSLLAALAG